MNKIILVLALLVGLQLTGQDFMHKKIDDAQKLLCKKDSLNNCIVQVSTNREINLVVTSYVINKVDEWQVYINALPKTVTVNDRVRYLRVLYNYLIAYTQYAKSVNRSKDYTNNLAKELFANFKEVIGAYNATNDLATVVQPLSYLATKIITEDEYAPLTTGYAQARNMLILKDCTAHPDKILSIVNTYPNIPSADSLITVAAMYNQDKIYDYAQCTKCPIYPKLYNHSNPLVKTLFKMAQMETGRSLTPFLDAISNNQISIDSINKIQSNQAQYYKLLVHTRITYYKRILAGESILAINNFNEKIKEVALSYVKEINEAHTLPDVVRFAPLTPLNSQELYYMAVYGIDELFTSSFNRGVYAQLIAKLGTTRTDQLLAQVQQDYFRKFVKITANYNKLASFLKLMPDSSGKALMSNFITNLVTNDNLQDIEDAVDVADAYVGISASLELKPISDLILKKVKDNALYYTKQENEKGMAVYTLFDKIFNAYKDTTNTLATQLGLPPITQVPYSIIAPKDKTVVKLYFYGDEDKDGQNSFIHFMALFADKSKWKVEANPWYVYIKSTKGKAIEIYANRALYDVTKKTDPDDTAKLKMSQYMYKAGIQPTFVMHRGHSYHVPITLQYMERYDTAAKLIVLGSCGGYQNLQKVLEICPDAHIVSSKQTGTMHVNDPMLQEMFTDIGAGKSIQWPRLWQRVKVKVGGGEHGEMFDEYIPPNQNLGMIFIKAYKKQMGI